MKSLFVLPFLLVSLWFGIGSAWAEDQPPTPAKENGDCIGVYDSRAVAYAHFLTEKNQKRIDQLFDEAKNAEKAGNRQRVEEIRKIMKEGQRRIHRQVFSTAPIDNVLKEMEKEVLAIQEKAGVGTLISKWDDEKLKEHRAAKQIDVTDRLIDAFELPEKQREAVEQLRKTKPVSLEAAESCD